MSRHYVDLGKGRRLCKVCDVRVRVGKEREHEESEEHEAAAMDFCGWCSERLGPDENAGPPAVENDEAWAQEAREHAPDCERITTRGFQLSRE